jgi:hypothetical protein
MRNLIWITLLAAAGCGGGGGGGGSSSLAGTWELSSGNSSSSKGMMVLSSSRLTLTLGDATFDLQVSPSATLAWTTKSDAPAFTVTRTAADVDFGALPVALGGDWMIHGPHGGSCIGSVRADAITGGCSGVGSVPSGLPSLNRQVQIAHASTLDSIFGALGGVWNLSDDKGASCNATFSGATLTAKCKASATSSEQSVTVTFGDGIASGMTNGGIEFSARRL